MAKRLMMQQEAQGWSFTDHHVCKGCVADDALAAAIAADEDADETCDFCGHSPAAPLDSLLAIFVDGLRNEYGRADDEGVYYDGREGGYQWGETWDTWDLIHDEFGDVLIGDGLTEAVWRAMEDTTWVEKDFIWPRRDEALGDAWEQFCETVKYETRYVLWLRDDVEVDEAEMTGEIPPALVLQEIGKLLERLNLAIRTLPAGYRLWRARTHHAEVDLGTASELGTAPREYAKQANRMTPAGIPMFYGASEADTAIREVAVRSTDTWATAGCFETSKPCVVVDFTKLPETPACSIRTWAASGDTYDS
jgi:hypothetical protein